MEFDPKTCTVDQWLKMTEEVLLRGDLVACSVWDIMSALRGPDRLDQDKLQTTIPLRSRAFPHVTSMFGSPYVRMQGPAFNINAIQFVRPCSDNHFSRHIQQADDALKLAGR